MPEKIDPYRGPKIDDTGEHIPFIKPASPFKGAHDGVQQRVDMGSLHRRRMFSKGLLLTVLGVMAVVTAVSLVTAILFFSLQSEPEPDPTPLRQKFYAEHK